MPSIVRFRVLTLLLLALSGAARAETLNCTVINALPFVIDVSGIYCLNGSHNVFGDGIHVNSNDVVVDLNGYMDNTVGGAATPFFGGTAAGRTKFSF